jgi:hypothetical protein
MMNFLECEDRVHYDPLTLLPALVISAEDTAYYGKLRDFIPRRVLPFDYRFKLLYWLHGASLTCIFHSKLTRNLQGGIICKVYFVAFYFIHRLVALGFADYGAV